MRLHTFSGQSVTDVCIPAASALIEPSSLPLERALLLKPGVGTAGRICICVSEVKAAANTSNWSYSLLMLER